jgi:hypothetical protein
MTSCSGLGGGQELAGLPELAAAGLREEDDPR